MKVKRPSNKQNKTDVGSQFESRVASLFASAGYQVERNQYLYGQQIDLIVIQHDGLGISRKLVVECKFKTKTQLSNADVQDFHRFTSPLLSKGLSGGILVTNTDFSNSAKAFAEQHPFIVLRTYASLEDSLFDFTRSFITQTANYESQDIAANYIELTAQRTISSLPGSAGRGVSVNIVADLLNAFSSDRASAFCFILGDFGAGKTTVLERLNNELQKRYISDRNRQIPLLFRLGKFVEAPTLDHYIEAQIAFSLKLNVQSSRILNLCSSGRAIVLLDGFDEIGTNADENRRLSYFDSLLPLINACRFVAISSRPSYFRNFSEFSNLMSRVSQRRFTFSSRREVPARATDPKERESLNYVWHGLRDRLLGPSRGAGGSGPVYYVRQLTANDIVAYIAKFEDELRRRHRLSPKEIYEVLQGVYDISDLMTRPLLLKLIVEVLLIGKINLRDPNLSIGPAALYRLYIDAHLMIDWAKGSARHFLSKDERLLFAKGMALALLTGDGSLTASYSDIVDAVTRVSKSFEPERQRILLDQVDEVCTDVRVCSFLRLRANDRFEFIHKSFMEFLIADQIRDRLNDDAEVELLELNLNFEIVYFLGSFALIEREILRQLRYQLAHVAYRKSSQYKSNILATIFCTGRTQQDWKFSDGVVTGLKLRDVRWTSLELSSISFVNMVARTIEIELSSLERVTFDGVEIQSLILNECRGTLDLRNCQIGKIKVMSSGKLDLILGVGQFGGAHIRNVSTLTIGQKTEIVALNVSGGSVCIEGSRENAIESLTVANATVMTRSVGELGPTSRAVKKLAAANARFRGCSLRQVDFHKMNLKLCSGAIAAHGVEEKEPEFSRKYQDDEKTVRRDWAYRDGVLLLDVDRLGGALALKLEQLLANGGNDELAKDPVKTVEERIRLLRPVRAPDFSLMGIEGNKYSLRDLMGRSGLLMAFLSADSLQMTDVMPVLLGVARSMRALGIGIVAIIPKRSKASKSETLSAMMAFSKSYRLWFPLLLDETQGFVRSMNVRCVPDFVGLNRDREIHYHGRLSEPGAQSGDRSDLFLAMVQIARTSVGPEKQYASTGIAIDD